MSAIVLRLRVAVLTLRIALLKRRERSLEERLNPDDPPGPFAQVFPEWKVA
jgi:hypothetical protein